MPEMTAEEYLIHEVQVLKDAAKADPTYQLTCIQCKEKVVFVEADHAVAKGHIYSHAGRREFSITEYCEFCFDECTKEAEDEEDDPIFAAEHELARELFND